MSEPDGWIVSCPGCRRPYIYDSEWGAPDGSCPECGDPEVEVTPFLRTAPDPDDREGLVEAAFREGFAAGYESGMDDAHYHSPAGEGVEDAWAESDARDRLQAQEASDEQG